MENDENLILVAQLGDDAYIRVQGKGSFKNAKMVKSFYDASIANAAKRCVFDLQECIHMDSTFMGVMAAISAEQKRLSFPLPIIVNINERNMELLSTLGLDRVLEILGVAPPEVAEGLTRLETTPEPSKEESAETMLEAHESLIELDERNRVKFRDVVDFLRDKLDREKSS